MESKQNGWVILSEDGNIIYDFTFRSTRGEAIRKYTRLWTNQNWKRYYARGVRCVKAQMNITITDK